MKLVEARRKEKEPTVVLEVDISSDSEPLVGKCSHYFDSNGTHMPSLDAHRLQVRPSPWFKLQPQRGKLPLSIV